ncbi:HEPN domain-containing protein [Domibacillus iocasae]|uniref:HEPN domain-containing protein n=1 Tax=Domibacillus iocasae TaxID=1714016 RepID=UPI00114C8B71|nr:HEPN domain-containing protein [Domibacillus iocasae]
MKDSKEKIELIEGHHLRKATSEEIKDIKEGMDSLGNSDGLRHRHESISKPIDNGYKFEEIDEKDWNYWVIEVNKSFVSSDFVLAITLWKNGLNKLFELLYTFDKDEFVSIDDYFKDPLNQHTIMSIRRIGSATGIINQPNIYFNFLDNDADDYNIIEISEVDAEDIKTLYTLVRNFRADAEKYPYIQKALVDFGTLKMISKKTPFFYVGIFSIIESLLAHNPSGDGDKGITHQLSKKLLLLNKRFKKPLVLKEYFNNPANFEKTIGKLYNYRSTIAHGDFANFESTLQSIESKEKATEFLYVLLKNLIIISLEEPELVSDLKNL